jgi:flavin-binding protein dodecin
MPARGFDMDDYERKARVTEFISGSPKSFEHAIQVGFKRASRTLRGIAGINISDFRCKVENDEITEYRVTLRVTFVLDT